MAFKNIDIFFRLSQKASRDNLQHMASKRGILIQYAYPGTIWNTQITNLTIQSKKRCTQLTDLTDIMEQTRIIENIIF